MTNLFRVGSILFGIAIACLGAQNLIYADFLGGLEPVPAVMNGLARSLLAALLGLLFLAASVSILLNFKPRLAAIVLGVVLFVLVLLLHLPNLAANLNNGGAWTTAFEMIALTGAAWVLATGLRNAPDLEENRQSFFDKLGIAGRLLYGVSLPVFGVLHFIYSAYVAGAVPGWIPAPYFWAYFTGVAHIAAGLSLLSNVKARLAALLLAVMFGSWVLILHSPRAVKAPGARAEWTSLFVALAMCGGALMLADSLRRKKAIEDNQLTV